MIAILHGKGPSIEEALAGKRSEAPAAEILRTIPVITLPPSATFSTLLDTLVTNRLHRVYVVDGDNKPASIITLTDVLRTVCEEVIIPDPVAEEPVAEEEEDGLNMD